MRYAHLKTLSLIGILCLLLFGCTALPASVATADAAPTQNPGPSAALIPLKVAVTPYLSYSAFYIALEEGYFAQAGLDIEVLQTARPSVAMPALVQGEVDIMGTNVSTAILNTIARAGNVKIVAATAQQLTGECPYTGVITRLGLFDDTDGTLAPERLPEYHFFNNSTTIDGFALDTLLQQHGSSLAEITLVDLPGSAQMMEPLRAGTLDMATATEPWLTRAQSEEIGAVWLSTADILGDTQTSIFVFGPTMLQENHEVGVRFIRAYLQGVAQLQAGKTPRNLAILQKYFELDDATLAAVCMPTVPTDGKILIESIDRFVAWAVEQDYIDRALTSDEFWDPTFVDAAGEMP